MTPCKHDFRTTTASGIRCHALVAGRICWALKEEEPPRPIRDGSSEHKRTGLRQAATEAEEVQARHRHPMGTVERKALLAVLSKAATVAQGLRTLPILSNVHLRSEQGRLTVTATDLEVYFRAVLPADLPPFETTLPAKTMRNLVKASSAEYLSIAPIPDKEEWYSIGSAQLAGLPVADYPTIPAGPGILTTNGRELIDSIRTVAPAMSSDDTRYQLNGVFLDGGTVVATDGHRLHLDGSQVYPYLGIPAGILPSRMVKLACAWFRSPSFGVAGNGGPPWYVFEEADCALWAQGLDGEFPDYQRVIPKDHPSAMVESERFEAALRAVLPILTSKKPGVRVTVNGSLAIYSNNLDTSAEASASAPWIGEEWPGAEVVVGANARYLLDALVAMGSGPVRFEAKDGLSEMVFRKDGRLAVVAPMRI